MAKQKLLTRFRDWLVGPRNIPHQTEAAQRPRVNVPGFPKPVVLPNGRSSIPHNPIGSLNIIAALGPEYRIVNHQFVVQVIPIIRRLMMINEDVSQAIDNIITLGNTGHKVQFDKTIPLDQVELMRDHLENKKLIWSAGCAGMDGLINKMFAQLLVGGALSNEWVPNKKINGIDSVILVNPEDITFTLTEGNLKYTPWQRIIGGSGWFNPGQTFLPSGLIPLNPYTYRYYGLNGDTEVPYGFPPYMAALERIVSANNMKTNIDFVIDQMGLLGFLEVLMGKPDKIDGETQDNYSARLDTLLVQSKNLVMEGIKDGVVVGFEGDHTFKFNSMSRAVKEALEVFQNNESLVGSGLKQDMTMLGRDSSTSETQITVVFMKMLSQLKNMQNIIKANLEFGYALELTLAGFNFKYLKVVFNRSTLQDDLKYNQAAEIKVRNLERLRLWGIISQDQFADEMGYEAPYEEEPIVDPTILAGGAPEPPTDAEGNQKKQKGKDASDKKVRQKNKPISTK